MNRQRLKSKGPDDTMRCRRCTGLMVPERFYDFQDDTGRLTFLGWRCLVCGEVVDPVILAHRTRRPAEATRRGRRMPTLAG